MLQTSRPQNLYSWLLVLTAILSGCSRGSISVDMGGEDGSQVAAAIEELNEVKNNAKKSGEFFVSKQLPVDVKKFNQFSYYVVGKPSITGTTASCKVLIEKADGTPMGDQEWTFEKVAEQWKIKSAPLP